MSAETDAYARWIEACAANPRGYKPLELVSRERCRAAEAERVRRAAERGPRKRGSAAARTRAGA